jgi:hypothetical protein
MALKELLWRLLLPLCIFTPLLSSTIHDNFLVKDWHRLYLTTPRFLLYLIILNRKFNFLRIILAYLIESIALSFVAWLFGRSIMYER